MSRDYAERLVSYLDEAEEALERASRAAAGFPKEERVKFDEVIYGLIAVLQSDVWKPIYDEVPDLAPEYQNLEPWEIDSELSWEEARLLPDVSEKEVDGILLPLLKPYWQKVLRVLSMARDACNTSCIAISDEVLAARLRWLSNNDKIEGIGDLRRWGQSEVRLKD